MKSLLAIAIWMTAGCASSSSPPEPDFKLRLSYDTMEHSRDSHGTVTTLVIDGRKVVYSPLITGRTRGLGRTWSSA